MSDALTGTPMSKGPSALTERDHNANFVSPRSAAAVTLSSFSRCLLSQPCPAGTHRSVPCDGLTQEGPNAATTMGRSHYSGGSSLVDHDVPAASDRAPWPLPDAGVIRAQNPRESRASPPLRPVNITTTERINKLTHPADHSLVTPTPSKKPRSAMVPGMPTTFNGETHKTPVRHTVNDQYDRKRKSLGSLAVIVTEHLSILPPGTIILVDELAKELQVERRRIYDVINILESVYMVTKHAKNTYVWLTVQHLPHMLALLQQEALTLHRGDARENGLLPADHQFQEPPSSEESFVFHSTEAKSLCRLSQQFLHIFLVGHESISLAKALEKISGRTWTEEELAALVCKGGLLPQNPKELSAMAAKGMKTKIRRLYDVGNVLAAIGILTKFDERHWARNTQATTTKPMYMWSYHISPRNLLTQVHEQMPMPLKRLRTPFVDGARLSMMILKMLRPPDSGSAAKTSLTNSESPSASRSC